MNEGIKLWVLIIVTVMAIVVIKATPDWRDLEADFNIDTVDPNLRSLIVDPNMITTGSTTFDIITMGDIDPNSFIYVTGMWVPPVYNCPTHGEVKNVIAVYTGSSEFSNTCVQCFLDVFPPLEKVK